MKEENIMYKLPQKIQAMVRSLNSEAEVTILEKVGDNNYLAEYQNKICTAIFNPFVGLYYVDDVYGIVERKK